ncbi:hypothetical protein MHUMG1_02367 [Metarhizium humberi]|uniref:Uncharacterized protein n=1 Tax=Metarhizium humberi TaxID=2596975 RepID=A0A9P8S9E5_9HYPO|nr:hypothetical protein MHUMG1_02367 [Metarhizium humberi]
MNPVDQDHHQEDHREGGHQRGSNSLGPRGTGMVEEHDIAKAAPEKDELMPFRWCGLVIRAHLDQTFRNSVETMHPKPGTVGTMRALRAHPIRRRVAGTTKKYEDNRRSVDDVTMRPERR